MKERGQTDRPCKMSWKFLSDLLSKSTPISATHLHRTTTLQWRLCIRYHVFFFRSPPSPPSLPFHPFTSPTTLPHCKVRVAKFKSQNECRLGASRVYIGHPFVCIFAYSSTPRVNLYVCICVFLCVYVLLLRLRLLTSYPSDLRECVLSRQRDYSCEYAILRDLGVVK